MSRQGWRGSIAVAAGVSALASAAQVGLGYGLGIMSWQPVRDAASEAIWLNSLTWTIWLATTAVVAGAFTADRLSRGPIGNAPNRTGGALSVAWRTTLSLAAAVGAVVTIPLIAFPARAATRSTPFAADVVAAGYATVGVLIGMAVAGIALTSRAVAANAITTAVWVWALAAVAVADAVSSGAGLHTAQLAVWRYKETTELVNGTYDIPLSILMLGAALVIGALACVPAVRRGDGPVGIAISGALGPALIAISYLLTASNSNTVRAEQHSPGAIAPYAMFVGLAGSVLVGRVARNWRNRPRTPAQVAAGPPSLVSAMHPQATAPATPRSVPRQRGGQRTRT
jgi:hypothetical protein